MVVCKFFQQGRCAFGDDCKYEHTQEKTKQNTFGNQSWTASSSRNTTKSAGVFTIESMTKDLTPKQEKPLWPLTSYAPGKSQPVLIGGIDESFEELRVRAVTALKSGTINEYTKYEADKIAAADQVYSNALANISQAFEQAQRQYFDFEALPAETSKFEGKAVGTTGSAFGGGGTMSAFGTTPTSVSAFGQPAFGQSAFGQLTSSQTANPPAAPATTSAFGQPQQTSAFGQTSLSDTSTIKPAPGAFGSSSSGGAFSAFAGSGASPFGSGSSPSSGGFSAFAQPSAFGSGTGTTPAGSGGSVFGQSSFGNALTGTSAFGAPAQDATSSAFAQPSAFGTSQSATGSAFGVPAFSTTNAGSLFGPGGSASTNSTAANPSGSVFGPGGNVSTSTPGSVFGSGENAPTNAFSSNTNSLSAFAASPQAPTSVFGNASTSSPFSSQPSAPLPEKPQPGPPDFATAKSIYNPDTDKYASDLPDNYMGLLPPAVKAAFENIKFEWGKVPEWTPPKELR